ALDRDNNFAWRLMAQARDAAGENGAARLATAEEHFSLGDMAQARIFAMRARDLLPKNSPEWRRATDIVLVAEPSKEDLKRIGGTGEIPLRLCTLEHSASLRFLEAMRLTPIFGIVAAFALVTAACG